jgi:hypothetical protein
MIILIIKSASSNGFASQASIRPLFTGLQKTRYYSLPILPQIVP